MKKFFVKILALFTSYNKNYDKRKMEELEEINKDTMKQIKLNSILYRIRNNFRGW
jgi:hypothetical protein